MIDWVSKRSTHSSAHNRYPAEVISVNTSGKHFQRMCAARKSTSGGYAGGATAGSSSSTSPENAGQTEGNNLDDNVQTVSRRSRSRKVRGKRRNTIAGIDQKEIQDAANGYVIVSIYRSICLYVLPHGQVSPVPSFPTFVRLSNCTKGILNSYNHVYIHPGEILADLSRDSSHILVLSDLFSIAFSYEIIVISPVS